MRWVLGETSAKQLRGETMQDVLFNGSGQRKPVNRASVELVFDNSLGKAAGQWSQYAEISIKRVLQRDGDSSYYINNTHVRRRDIADIFLGTGLGARAYAIIEQGMISRVIEAKPEELRVFLEEAAGVSKYRERRRETELRLEGHAREPAARRRHPAGARQAARAPRRAGRGREALSRAAGRARDDAGPAVAHAQRSEAASARARHAREIERLGVELEAETAKLREAEKRLEALRDEHYRAGDAMHAAQGALYESNAEVARLEQQIAHVRENRSRIEHQIAQPARAARAAPRRSSPRRRRTSTTGAAQSAEAQRAPRGAPRRRSPQKREKLPVAEEAYRASNNRRDELQRALARAEQALHVERTKLEHAARVLEQLAQREERLREEQAALPVRRRSRARAAARRSAASSRRRSTAQRASSPTRKRALPELEQALRGRARSARCGQPAR